MKKMTLYAVALCALSMTACADRMNKSSADNSAGNTGSSSSGYAPSSMTGPSTTSTSQSSQSGQYTPSTTSTAQTSYGMVQAIDQMQRQDVGVGMVGAAAAGGTTSGMPTDKVYRVTVRLDDGTMQTVVLESSPSYKIGDRVRYSNGTVQAY